MRPFVLFDQIYPSMVKKVATAKELAVASSGIYSELDEGAWQGGFGAVEKEAHAERLSLL